MQETRRDFLKTAGKAAAVVGAAISSSFPSDESVALANGSDAAFWRRVCKMPSCIDPKLHYHNIGGTGALPRHVVKNYHHYNKTIARNPDAGYNITQMRTDIAPGFGANADEIVLTTNTTDGMCMSLNGLDWSAGDEIISTNMEHPGGNGPMAHVAARKGVIIKRALLPVGADAQPQDFINAFAAQLTSQHQGDLLLAHPVPHGGVAASQGVVRLGEGTQPDLDHRRRARDRDAQHRFPRHGRRLLRRLGSQMAVRAAWHGHLVRAQPATHRTRWPLPMIWGVLVSGTATSPAASTRAHRAQKHRQLPAVARALERARVAGAHRLLHVLGLRSAARRSIPMSRGLSAELKRRVVATWGRPG